MNELNIPIRYLVLTDNKVAQKLSIEIEFISPLRSGFEISGETHYIFDFTTLM